MSSIIRKFSYRIFSSKYEMPLFRSAVHAFHTEIAHHPNPGVYPLKYEKAANFSAALHRIFCSNVWSLPDVALFRCIFCIGTFFGFIRVYTVLFSGPKSHATLCENLLNKAYFILFLKMSKRLLAKIIPDYNHYTLISIPSHYFTKYIQIMLFTIPITTNLIFTFLTTSTTFPIGRATRSENP